MRALRRYILLSLALLDILALSTEYLIPALSSQRDGSILHDLLWYSISLLDATKQEGPASVFTDLLIALRTTIYRLVCSLITSALKVILGNIASLGSTLATAGRTCTQLGVTSIDALLNSLWKISNTYKSALGVTLLSAWNLCTSNLDRFHHLGVFGPPLACLYLTFIVYSYLRLAHDFICFIGSVVGAVVRKTRTDNQATPGDLGRYMDVGVETEDEDIFGGKGWDDSLVTPRSSRRSKRAMSGERAGRKSLQDVLSEF